MIRLSKHRRHVEFQDVYCRLRKSKKLEASESLDGLANRYR